MIKIPKNIMSIDKLPKRTAMTLFGVIICAVSVGIFKIAALGVDPFQSFMAGLDALVPIDFGTLYVLRFQPSPESEPSSQHFSWDLSLSSLMFTLQGHY